jgi:CRISPR-associated endonuclease/helicase Cas3
MNQIDFDEAFQALTGNAPFPWQRNLYDEWFSQGNFPPTCNLPTGLGKTNVIAVWLIALANGCSVPRRLVYVVNRRTVVDQTTAEIVKFRNQILGEFGPPPEILWSLRTALSQLCAVHDGGPLAISTLRGQFADNREWSADPSRPAVICGTVDMIGSRLLFSGYGIGFKARPLHAGFLGQDALLIHDEAHLEPAFQKLIEAIRDEQHEHERTGKLPWPKLAVLELSATPRGNSEVFKLTPAELNPPQEVPEPPQEPIHHVWRRLRAKKGIRFAKPVPRNQVAATIGQLARARKASGQAILVFVRTVEDVKTVQQLLTDKKEGVPADQVAVLTGTLRGLERDRLVETAVFRRLLLQVPPDGRTVYLVCTSAGEVGVDISADHLACDLTPLDSMAQRLGRVNRRGGGAAEIDVILESDPDPKPKSPEYEKARWRTLEILRRLPQCDWIDDRQDSSPAALGQLNLTAEQRKAAFAPEPRYFDTSDILFDAWALTTIRGKLPGRPPVEPYLHGESDYDPPQTTVAWRDEVTFLTPEVLGLNKLTPEEVLELYPLKPHEELCGSTYGKGKVFEQLEKIAARDAKREPDKRLSAWVIDPDGSVAVYLLAELVEKDKQNQPRVSLNGRTVVLPPQAGGFSAGLLKGDEPFVQFVESERTINQPVDKPVKDDESVVPTFDYDVSDRWYADSAKTVVRRIRVWDDDEQFAEKTKGMRLVRRIDFPAGEEDQDAAVRSWHWFTRPRSADDDASKTSATHGPITWDDHTKDVACNAQKIADALLKYNPDLHSALVLAARYHDLGKKRRLWQRSIGHALPKEPKPGDWLAKSGRGMKPIEFTDYRHELGSLVDLEANSDFRAIASEHVKELVRHLIAVHHGYGRPHFPADLVFDPEPKGQSLDEIATAVVQRFARLQRKYGRWGLAYLESLLRAADWAASAHPSPEGFVEDDS